MVRHMVQNPDLHNNSPQTRAYCAKPPGGKACDLFGSIAERFQKVFREGFLEGLSEGGSILNRWGIDRVSRDSGFHGHHRGDHNAYAVRTRFDPQNFSVESQHVRAIGCWTWPCVGHQHHEFSADPPFSSRKIEGGYSGRLSVPLQRLRIARRFDDVPMVV
jgi:hypothetical protein